jgi:hypothetical protein
VRVVARRAESASCCHVLFVEGTDGALDAWLQPTQGRPVLTVTDDEEESQHVASVINFVTVDEHVRFDISRAAAERNGLHLSSQLLTVARHTTP